MPLQVCPDSLFRPKFVLSEKLIALTAGERRRCTHGDIGDTAVAAQTNSARELLATVLYRYRSNDSWWEFCSQSEWKTRIDHTGDNSLVSRAIV